MIHMADAECAIVVYIVKNDDGSIGIRLDDAIREDSKRVVPIRLFTIVNCSEESFRSVTLSDEQFADLGNALVARLAALHEIAGMPGEPTRSQ